MSLWNTPSAQFSVEHPNAALIGYMPQNGHHMKRVTAVLVLKDANYNPVTKTLTYQVKKSYLLPDKKSINQSLSIQYGTLWIDVAKVLPVS